MSCVSEGQHGARLRGEGTCCRTAQMESMLHAPRGKLDKATHVVNSVRDQEVEKCLLVSRGPSAPPAGRDAGKTVENSEGDGVEYAESVASECSVESNASSNVPDGDCGDCEADSPSDEERNLKRCPSGGSIVTYDEAASKLREEGDCERTGDRRIARRSEGSLSHGFDDDQEISINADQVMAESNGPAWTDDKHCSYLNSIEQTFVQSLFGQDYHTVDGSGEDDPDCVESRPMYGNPYGIEMFRSLQRGCYAQGEYYRPQFLHTFGLSTAAVFLSPWIQHFNPRGVAPGHGSAGAGQEAETGNPSAGFVDGAYGPGNFASSDAKEEVKESIPNLNNPENGLQQATPSWSSRFQSQHHASTSPHIRPDVNLQAKKRNLDSRASTSPHVRPDAGLQAKKRNLDPGSDAAYRPKKLKTTQRLLAEIDLEMEEQFVLKQKHLKELAEDPELKDGPQSLGGVHGGFDLNQELVDEDETKPEDTSRMPPLAETKTIDFVSHLMEPISSKTCASEASMENRPFEPKLCPATFLSRPLERDFGEGSSGVKKLADATGYNASPGLSLKLRQDEANLNHQADSGFDEEEEFEFLLSRSPRASKTYKWGGAIGPRRLLHKDCNGLVEAAALPGNGCIRDSKDHELPSKGSSEWK